jgi:hypothetical protein
MAESHVDYPERGVALLLELVLSCCRSPPAALVSVIVLRAAEEPGEETESEMTWP